MRNLLALAALGLIAFLGVGWYLGWYQVKTTPTADGHNKIEVDLNTAKIKHDVKDDVNKVEGKVNNWLNDKNNPTPQSSNAPGGVNISFTPNPDGSFSLPPLPTPPSGGPNLPTPH
jgi:hypothetical protein